MSEIIVFSSNNSDEREIDKYHNENMSSGRSDNSRDSSSDRGNTLDEQYLSSALGIPLEVF